MRKTVAVVEQFMQSRNSAESRANGDAPRQAHMRSTLAKSFLPVEATEQDMRALRVAGKYAAVGNARLYALIKAAKHIVHAKIPGAAVVCGVGLGGSTIAITRTLRNEGDTSRPTWLYDTFDSETRSEYDDYKASQAYIATVMQKRCRGYDQSALVFVEGMVEDTIPGTMPDAIALMHLDLDWYAPTKHVLAHLWQRIVPGGVVLIDDYGCWASCRKAVDEYFAENDIHVLLNVVDYTGRIGVKV